MMQCIGHPRIWWRYDEETNSLWAKGSLLAILATVNPRYLLDHTRKCFSLSFLQFRFQIISYQNLLINKCFAFSSMLYIIHCIWKCDEIDGMEAMVNETDIGWYYRLLSSRRIWWMNASGQIHRRPLITMYLACYHSFDNYVLFYSFYSLSIFTLFYLTFGGFRHCQFISVSVAGIQPVIYSPTNVSARHTAQIHLFLFIPHYWW